MKMKRLRRNEKAEDVYLCWQNERLNHRPKTSKKTKKNKKPNTDKQTLSFHLEQSYFIWLQNTISGRVYEAYSQYDIIF